MVFYGIAFRLVMFMVFVIRVIFNIGFDKYDNMYDEPEQEKRPSYEDILKTCKCIPYDESLEYYDDSDYEEDIIFEDDLAVYYEKKRKKK
jgi:hypothetical protein